MSPNPPQPPSTVPNPPPQGASGKPETRLDPERWIDDHGDYLYHYALSRLRDPVRAEDFVQDALLGALRSMDRYEGRSAERTWLTGILRNKILDHFRKSGRETTFTDLDFYAEEEKESFANPSYPDHWTAEHGPNEWKHAGENLDHEAFWKAFQSCSAKLPERVARVFLMREVDAIESDAICETLNITPNNLWVMLHRARMALRRCLEVSWFGKPSD